MAEGSSGESYVGVIAASGPLGLALSTTCSILNVAPGGQAEAAGVKAGDSLTHVAGTACEGLEHDAVLGLIRAAARPLTLTFSRPAPPPKAAGGSGLARAGTFMKGLLSTGVQVIQGVEKVIDKVVDDNAKHAKVRSSAACGGAPHCVVVTFHPPPCSKRCRWCAPTRGALRSLTLR